MKLLLQLLGQWFLPRGALTQKLGARQEAGSTVRKVASGPAAELRHGKKTSMWFQARCAPFSMLLRGSALRIFMEWQARTRD